MGQNQNWPTSGPGGYITPAIWGLPNASEEEIKSQEAHKWASGLHKPCLVGGPQRFKTGEQNQQCITTRPGGYTTPAIWRVPNALEKGTKSEVPHKWAGCLYEPCHLRGCPTLMLGGQNQMWPTSGLGGYITPTMWRVPNASERGTKLAVAHKWAWSLHNPCHLGGCQCFRAGKKISSGPQVGMGAT